MNVEVRVITRAKRKEVTREGDVLKVKLLSLPRDGKANEELTEYVAELFGIRKSGVAIVKGERDKRKVLSLAIGEEQYRKGIDGIEEKS